MKKLSVALLLFLGLANAALAQTKFTMPPPAGVFLGGYQVVTTCGTAAALVAGNLAFGAMDTTGAICTNASGGGGGLSVTDQAAWTQASSSFTPGGGTFNDAATLSSGQQGTFRMTTKRAQIVDTDTTGSALYSALTAALPAQASNAVNIGAVMNAGSAYETVAASQTGQALGATGATGDYLSHCVIYPTSTTPGVVTVFDSTSTTTNNVITFPGGASSISNLAPIAIPVGAVSINGAWKATTGANLLLICYGKFT